MPRARIKINGTVGSDLALPLGVAVTLSNDNVGDESSYTWELASKPSGSAAVLSSATAASPTFTPDLDGSYLVRLRVDANESTEDADGVVAAVPLAATGLRPPAQRERGESDTAAGRTAGDGWSPEIIALVRFVNDHVARGGDCLCTSDPGIAVGKWVQRATGGTPVSLDTGDIIAEVEAADDLTVQAYGVVVHRFAHDTSLCIVRTAGPHGPVDTSGAAVGDRGYIVSSGTGEITFTEPYTGAFPVCTVLSVDAAGSVNVDIGQITADQGSKLEKLESALSIIDDTSAPAVGDAVYVSANNKVSKADAKAAVAKWPIGVRGFVTNSVNKHGSITMNKETGNAITHGNPVYLCSTDAGDHGTGTAGKVSGVKPTSSGSIVFVMGIALADATMGASSVAIVGQPQYVGVNP